MSEQVHTLDERAARLRQPGKQFSLGFFTQVPGPADRTARRTYDELVETIVAAEEIGYDSVWIGQHHFSPEDGSVPSPLVVLAAAAARTTRIQLGTAVIALPFEHPIRLAEDLSVLDEISGGRVQVGLGGARGDLQAFTTFGVDFAERHELFDRHLATLQHLLEQRPCTDFVKATNPAPTAQARLSASDSVAGQQATADQDPKRLFPNAPTLRRRLWQTASSEDRARKIARNGNGLMIGAFHDHVIHHQLPYIVGYLEEWAALNGNLDDARIGAQRFTYHGESADAVAEALDAHVASTQRGLADRFPQLGAASPREYLKTVARTGSAREIVQQLQDDPALFGFVTDFFPTTGLFPSVREGTAGADLDVERLRLFAEDIAPELGWKPAVVQ
ncbi:alkanesulfonate monooxygenase SsuD/methylene tetrahydromethanopterin reductase-like flavin-dependent oxidoreductase (luciferase family) [Mycobacterium sp. BK086]|uniref:LLM class flavin-dependent oxidoreductase n=1 Tax=Mycobacterium sp. BK086 TaxID=2512165 RepID=UPI001061A2F8|nr:LLM class flavin-dependent oxidoreductase [Mycobacterium sp. BK086]TDO18030.1 alkanesulfonate monooxygenase SsuD/methylene tetrahydromethanopterin reductase-like flavin-dependent oxidoreductase (luciferase family) [Mycobacterium sp. BK086]